MFNHKNPRKVLLIIFVITFLAILIDLPTINLPGNYQIGGYNLDINVLGTRFFRDLSIRRGLDLQGGVQVSLGADMTSVEESRRYEALEAVRTILERRVNYLGVAEPNIWTSKAGDEYRVVIEMPGVEDPEQVLDLIGQTAQLEFREWVEGEVEGEEGMFVPTEVDGRHLSRAWIDFEPTTGEPQVSFKLTDEGADKFEALTTRLIGKPLAIFLDNQLVSAPTVQSTIREQGRITGRFTTEEAKNLVIQLNAGALPVPIRVLEQRSVGATLGAESVGKSLVAGLVGLGLVAFFMVAYYGKLGLIADAALLIYALIVLALYKLIPVTVTLAGLAGFILSVGMAVDSNILIFEKIKEEINAGRSLKVALELGFGRAWDSIRDANVCTLITCFILFNPFNWSFLNTAGVIRGFALTLALGVGVSLFTGVVVTRTLVRLFYKK